MLLIRFGLLGFAVRLIVPLTTKNYARNLTSLIEVIQRLDNLKTNLGPTLAAKLEASYHSAGGEQFLTSTLDIPCKWILTLWFASGFYLTAHSM